ncbi:hypothetical protein J6590_016676 [Homalodisca vitripennis]|nr:hypothetical protein J6590_016676 [Homalodisca vitripennis]
MEIHHGICRTLPGWESIRGVGRQSSISELKRAADPRYERAGMKYNPAAAPVVGKDLAAQRDLILVDLLLEVPMAERSKMLDFESELETAQVRILSVTVAPFISTIGLVLYRLSPLFRLIRSSHRPVAHEDRIRPKRRWASP